MKRRLGKLAWAGLMCGLLLGGNRVIAGQDAARPNGDEGLPDALAGGEHFRLETELGPVHLWRPEDYDPRTAGTVVYVHGYFTSVDETWQADRLAAQFEASEQNALFIAPEAPASKLEEVSWKSLQSLLRAVDNAGPFPVPSGPVVVVGHSGAFRTILCWLPDPRMQEIVLLDGLYNGQREFRTWLRAASGARSHHMVLVASSTVRKSDRFARRIPGTARRRSVPADFSYLTPRERNARLLYLRSQYDHSEMISSGRVIPFVLKYAAATALPKKPLHSATVRGN